MTQPQRFQTAVSTPAWVEIAPVSYTLSEGEAAAANQMRAVAGRARGMPIVWVMLGIMNILLGVARAHFGHHGDSWLSTFYVAIGLLYFAIGVMQRSNWRPVYGKRQRNFSLRFTDAGIELATPTVKLLPWRSIGSVSDSGEAFTFQSATRPPLVIPKRVFDDRGAALWSALEAQLIGAYNLRRRTDSRTIYNTKPQPANATNRTS